VWWASVVPLCRRDGMDVAEPVADDAAATSRQECLFQALAFIIGRATVCFRRVASRHVLFDQPLSIESSQLAASTRQLIFGRIATVTVRFT